MQGSAEPSDHLVQLTVPHRYCTVQRARRQSSYVYFLTGQSPYTHITLALYRLRSDHLESASAMFEVTDCVVVAWTIMLMSM